MRYSRIQCGPARENSPQVLELEASEAIAPGSLMTISAGKFALAGATTVGKVYLAQENYLAQKGVADGYASGDTVLGLELEDECMYAGIVPTATNVTAVGTALAPGASGKLAIAATGDLVVGFADEAYNNASGADDLIRFRPAQTGYVVPA